MEIKLLPLKQCPYQDLFEDKGRKIGHVRADYDGQRWWTTYWPCNSELMTIVRKEDINAVCDHLLTQVFPNGRSDIISLCKAHPTTVFGNPDNGEYDFWVDGIMCGYWVRLITRCRDYNMYLHCFAKEGKPL